MFILLFEKSIDTYPKSVYCNKRYHSVERDLKIQL